MRYSLPEMVSAYDDHVVTVISFHDGQEERSLAVYALIAEEKAQEIVQETMRAALRNISL